MEAKIIMEEIDLENFLKECKSSQNISLESSVVKLNNEEYFTFVNNENDLLNLVSPNRQNKDSKCTEE